MKIGYLGCGTWGSALMALLASKDYEIKAWDRNSDLIQNLQWSRSHPKLSGFIAAENITYYKDIEDVIEDVDVIIESVTSAGVREVLQKIYSVKKNKPLSYYHYFQGYRTKNRTSFS